MKIAVVTDDSQVISAHFGRARYYEVFTLEGGQIVHRERRAKANHNQFGRGHHGATHEAGHGTDPASEHRHTLMLESIHDCQIVLVRGMGSGAFNRLMAGGIRPILTDISGVEEAVNAYLTGSLTDHPERLH